MTERYARSGPEVPPDWYVRGSGGPYRFTSWISFRLPDRSDYLWESRNQRKGAGPRTRVLHRAPVDAADPRLAKSPWLRFWAPKRLAWWVAIAFMFGSVLFIVGAAGSLVPEVFGGTHRMSLFAESCYFVGAMVYTASIYGQLLESINADDRITADRETHPPDRFRWFTFAPKRLSFLTPFVLLIGSLVFNYETTFALGAAADVLPRLGLWSTSLLGGVLFLASSLLQLSEATHHYVRFQPRNISWWVAVSFILGSVGFIIGALPGFGLPGLPTAEVGSGPVVVKLSFLGGGIAFLVGSYLMLPEFFTQLRAQGRAE